MILVFSEEAFNAFNLGDAYIRVAQDGLARARDPYLKDIRVRVVVSVKTGGSLVGVPELCV